MRFLVDECTGPAVNKWLKAEGHDVFSVFDQAQGIDDAEVLAIAVAEERILITNDKDFVIFLRLSDERSTNKIAVLKQILDNYSERLSKRFITATETKIRFAF